MDECYFKKNFMKRINVIDLDNTLIPFDSFRFFVLNKIRSGNVIAILYSILRKARFISTVNFKKGIILNTGLLNDTLTVNKIVSTALKSINPTIINMVKEHTNDNTINLLCSASPDVYVKKIAEHLNWTGCGSSINGKNFFHLWGQNKLKYIKTNFPQTDYLYNFAISDNESDIELLKKFRIWKLIK